MSKSHKNSNKASNKIGILLINLGTPSATDYFSVRRYLNEFLSDRRVIEMPKPLWQLILQGVILSFQPFKSVTKYKKIWNKELNESPLLTITRKQSEKLQSAMNKLADNIIVDFAMRYGQPRIKDKINELVKDGCKKILIMPLYPQYSATTTATVVDEVNRAIAKIRRQPTLRFLPPYYNNNTYIDALNKTINNHLQSIDFKPKKIIASYHGIPLEYHKEGDPYPCHCRATTKLVSAKSPLPKDAFITAFQSLFGRKEWVKPYAKQTLIDLAKSGINDIAVVAPAFASDCIETLEEINYELKDAFIDAGGKNFTYIDCLNDSDISINMLKKLATNELKGWI